MNKDNHISSSSSLNAKKHFQELPDIARLSLKNENSSIAEKEKLKHIQRKERYAPKIDHLVNKVLGVKNSKQPEKENFCNDSNT